MTDPLIKALETATDCLMVTATAMADMNHVARDNVLESRKNVAREVLALLKEPIPAEGVLVRIRTLMLAILYEGNPPPQRGEEAREVIG